MQLDDRELIARTLQAEAGNQGLGGMLAVGSVIKNRMGSGQSFRDVILAPAQFSAWNKFTGAAGGEQGQDMSKIKPSEDAYAAADALISGNIADITGGATHYYNPDISNPNWGASAGGDWTKIGSHVFGKAGDFRTGATDMIGAQAPQQMAQQEKPRGLLGGMIDRDFADQLYMAALAGSPNAQRFQPLIQSVQAGRQARREDAKEQKKLELAQAGRNATADYLESIGQTELGNLVRKGAITGANALSAVPKPDKTYQYQALAKDLLDKGLAKTEAEALQMALAQTKAGTTVNVGPKGQPFPDPPKDTVYKRNPDGTVFIGENGAPVAIPITGTKMAQDAAKALNAANAQRAAQSTSGMVVLEDIGKAIEIAKQNPKISTGFIGSLLRNVGGTPAKDLNALTTTIKANIGFDRLQRMREESPTGGALGQVAVQELEALQSTLGSLDTSQTNEQFVGNLERLEAQYQKSMREIYNAALKDQAEGKINTKTGRVISPLDYFSETDISALSGSGQSGGNRIKFDAQGNIIK